jgi:hypothetical protein
VFIILVGGFSQILKAVNSLPDQHSDKSFILPLLQNTNPNAVPTVKEANYLINGITASLDNSGNDYAWNRANLIYTNPVTGPDFNAVVQAINSKENLVWIVSDATIPANRFAFYTHAAYYESEVSSANVEDDSGTPSTIQDLDYPPSSAWTRTKCSTMTSLPAPSTPGTPRNLPSSRPSPSIAALPASTKYPPTWSTASRRPIPIMSSFC